jgi:ABC-type transporter Mla subunit MlaD
MSVCVDGVQVGSVDTVTVRPELGDRPVEVVLILSTPYELHIPAGSIAQVAEPGIMRPTIVDIDTREAQGPPIANGGAIEGRESRDDQTAHALGVVAKALADQAKARSDQQKTPSDPSKAKPSPSR